MSIDFSRDQKQTSDPSKPERLDQLSMPRLNILIVEDDDISQRLLKLMLRNIDHDVKYASNGIEAVQIVKSNEIDLVLMDVQMPLMDGLEATRQIREWESGKKHLTIVGLTAILDSAYGICLQAGMDNIISKPFDMEQLHEVIDACMNKKMIAVNKTANASGNQLSGSSILDVQGAVKRFAGDQENYTILLDEFILSLSGRFEELINACESGRWRELSNHAHNLKGLSANFGAGELSRKAFELDQCVKEGRYDQAKQKLGEIESSVKNLRAETLAFSTNLSSNKG